MQGVRSALVGAVWVALAALSSAQSIPLASRDGHSDFVLETSSPADQFYLVIGSLAEATQLSRVRVQIEAAEAPERLPVDTAPPDPVWKSRIDAQARLLARERRARPALDSFPSRVPPTSKSFHLYRGERDLENPANYLEVRAELRSVGRHGQIYVDHDDRNLPELDGTIAEIQRVFDQDIYPWAEHNLGRVIDIDRDGRFTIFLTSKLGSLQNGRTQVDGFVRGSDFFRDLPAPFSNRCDMLYLNAALKPGPHLRTVLAHEFTHAVIFCEHALATYGSGPTHQDEESWLNEGLAHLVENLHAFGWSNLEERISAYLSQPERYPLVVPDYYGAGLWRNPGTRGAAFLFLRSCVSHADSGVIQRLVQSPLRGPRTLRPPRVGRSPSYFGRRPLTCSTGVITVRWTKTAGAPCCPGRAFTNFRWPKETRKRASPALRPCFSSCIRPHNGLVVWPWTAPGPCK